MKIKESDLKKVLDFLGFSKDQFFNAISSKLNYCPPGHTPPDGALCGNTLCVNVTCFECWNFYCENNTTEETG